MSARLLLFDLDGTLLRNDKTVSEYTLSVLRKCREKGILTAIATARGESNAPSIIPLVSPDIVISSAGALVQYKGKVVHAAEFTEDETGMVIDCIHEICGSDCEITVDSLSGYYANYKEEVTDWGEVIPCDFMNFRKNSLKICANISDLQAAEMLESRLSRYRMVKFAGSNWYQITRRTATKGGAAAAISDKLGIPLEEFAAFGDDLVDIDMLKICGTGIAVGNALEAVKIAADTVTESNDNDGVAKYIEKYIL